MGMEACHSPSTGRLEVDASAMEASVTSAYSASNAASTSSYPPAPSPSLPDGLQANPIRTADPVTPLSEEEPSCPADMVLIEGEYCPGLVQPCLQWVEGGVRRCARFGESRCVGHRFYRRFCIDRYEYPNLVGVKPAVMVSWYDALRACEIEGKRLCLASEWTFACEGVQRYPY